VQSYIKEITPFRRTPYLRYTILEVALHILIPLPGYEGVICYFVLDRTVCNPISDFLMLIQILRIYLLVRVIFHFTKWSNRHSSIIW